MIGPKAILVILSRNRGQTVVEEVEMSMKILGPSSPGFSLGLGRAIEKEKPQTHGNQVKSHVTPAPPRGSIAGSGDGQGYYVSEVEFPSCNKILAILPASSYLLRP